MTGTVVLDASAAVARLLDDGADGRWVTGLLVDARLAAPQLLPFETANTVRRHALAGPVGEDVAAEAQADLLDHRITRAPRLRCAVLTP